jgi:hypothetical protein
MIICLACAHTCRFSMGIRESRARAYKDMGGGKQDVETQGNCKHFYSFLASVFYIARAYKDMGGGKQDAVRESVGLI